MYKRRKKIDYYDKNLANPFFHRRRKKRISFSTSWSGKRKLMALLILVLAGGLVWLIFSQTIFSINNITVRGAIRIPTGEIENLAWQQTREKRFLFFPQKNIFTFSKEGVKGKLEQSYSFEKLTINKNLPHTLVIDIQEKSYAFIWCEGEKYYYADIDGYMINEVSPLEIKQKKYPIIQNQGDGKIINDSAGGLGRIDINENHINYIINLSDRFLAGKNGAGEAGGSFQDLIIEKFIIDKDANTVKMALAEGPTVYFNTNEDQEKQIKKLLTIKEETLKDDFKNKSYIDLRYGDRVYYR
ncbi:MAG: FtsQ-type POTRA domain-containing protein [Patescibacteria group bacterium]